MTIQELFIRSNQALLKTINQINDDQWNIELPKGLTSKPTDLKGAVQYHTYDDAWVPDILAGMTKDEVGNKYEPLLTDDKVRENYIKYNQSAIDAVEKFEDLDKTTHLSYGDFSARDYLQHIISFRALRSYDIAKLIGADTKIEEDFAQALIDEFSPVIEDYRMMGLFPAAIEVAADASPQEKLLGMVGRT